MALNTGLRRDEIRLLKWGQVDFAERTLTVGRSKTKAGTGRVIPLNPPAFAVLVRWAGRFPASQSEDYVFPACENARIDTDKPDMTKIDPSQPIRGWRTAWRHALKRAGLNIRFHDSRHSCITKLAESQASEQTIMSIAGHVNRAMPERYGHIRIAAKRAALNAIAQEQNPAVLGNQGNQIGTKSENVTELQADAPSKLLN